MLEKGIQTILNIIRQESKLEGASERFDPPNSLFHSLKEIRYV